MSDRDRERSQRSLDYVADVLGVHHATVRRLIASGALTARRIGGQLRISDAELDRYLDATVLPTRRAR